MDLGLSCICHSHCCLGGEMSNVVLEIHSSRRAVEGPRQDAAYLFRRIRENDDAAVEELYRCIGRMLYGKCIRSGLPTADREDLCHDVFMTVIDDIQRDAIRDPQALLSYVATILRRRIFDRLVRHRPFHDSEEFDLTTLTDGRSGPEHGAIHEQRMRIIARVVASLKPLDREILERFYVSGQPKETIIKDLNLKESVFRLRKSRALRRARVTVAHMTA